jgi:hypothetical protein
MRLRITIVPAMLVAVAIGGAFTQANAAATTGKKAVHPSICAKSYNPYVEPVSILRSCGDTILKLQRVTSLPGGGAAYDYGAYTQFAPPPHFNVLKATDRQLQEYGIPTRKQLGSRWYEEMAHVRHFIKPPRYLVETPREPGALTCDLSCSGTWSGYLVIGHSYTGVTSSWYEPDFVSDPCYPTAFGQWAGIGGAYSGPVHLGQDGTVFGVSGIGPHQGFIETINNDNSGPVAVGLTASVDQLYEADAFWESSISKFEYFMENYYNGDVGTWYSRPVSVDERSAEVITEFPIGPYNGLTDYQYFTVRDPEAYWGDSWQNYSYFLAPGFDYVPVTMYDINNQVMSGPSANGDSWQMNFHRCD